MLRMCVCMHSHFIENHLIRILEYGPLISEVVRSHRCLESRIAIVQASSKAINEIIDEVICRVVRSRI
jgi:hypothetical protein